MPELSCLTNLGKRIFFNEKNKLLIFNFIKNIENAFINERYCFSQNEKNNSNIGKKIKKLKNAKKIIVRKSSIYKIGTKIIIDIANV
ncbi:MAG: hypothetical protein OHK0038_23590 [Flammeovirgaceae bacterium]